MRLASQQTFRRIYTELALLVASYLLMSLLGCNKKESISGEQERDADNNRDNVVTDATSHVALKSGLTYGELKKMIPESPEVEKQFQQTVLVKFLQSGVILGFTRPIDSTQALNDQDIPTFIKTGKKYKGTICGVHNGDPVSHVISTIRLSYPDANHPKGVTSFNGDILKLDKSNWYLSWGGTDMVRELKLEKDTYKDR